VCTRPVEVCKKNNKKNLFFDQFLAMVDEAYLFYAIIGPRIIFNRLYS